MNSRKDVQRPVAPIEPAAPEEPSGPRGPISPGVSIATGGDCTVLQPMATMATAANSIPLVIVRPPLISLEMTANAYARAGRHAIAVTSKGDGGRTRSSTSSSRHEMREVLEHRRPDEGRREADGDEERDHPAGEGELAIAQRIVEHPPACEPRHRRQRLLAGVRTDPRGTRHPELSDRVYPGVEGG